MKRSQPSSIGSNLAENPANNSSEDEDDVPNRANFCWGAGDLSSHYHPSVDLVHKLEQNPLMKEDAAKDVLGVASSELADAPEDLLDQLWQQVNALEDKQAWDLAMEKDPTYAGSQRLGMAFLRSVMGRPKQAAKRLTRHFQTKLDLFGEDRLVKDIELCDLDEYDMEALYSGGFQVLSKKDRAGRPILFGRYTCMKYREVKNMIRVLFYIWGTMVEDEAHQISGAVAIGFEIGKLPLERFDEQGSGFDINTMPDGGGFDRDLAREILKIPLSVPVRPMGYHICADSSQWQGIFDMVLTTLCKFVRLRIRMHYGTEQETKYAMMTHGIPVDVIPVSSSGAVDLTNHFQWIDQRRELEASRRRQRQG